ncbi:hypothetical protein ACNTMW_13425 [Planosporangium sp. 12N6]|uniref:hypothetical protein n=1 Tax=Planosporangium spinosum TaxID=3402278 RepID=UPI003CEE3E8F
MNIPAIAAGAQLTLTGYFALTHWVPMGRFNDLSGEHQTVNAAMQTAMAALAIGTFLDARYAIWIAAVYYTLWMIGHLMSWWVPYLTGWPHSSTRDKYPTGIPVLPARGNRPTPDLLHTILGLLSVAALATTWLAVTHG